MDYQRLNTKEDPNLFNELLYFSGVRNYNKIILEVGILKLKCFNNGVLISFGNSFLFPLNL